MLDDVIAELVLKQVCQSYLARITMARVHEHDWNVENFLEKQVFAGLRRTLEAILDDVGAELVQRKLDDVVDDGVYNLDFLLLEAVLKDVGDHVVSILLWCQLVRSADDLLNDRRVDVASRELLEYSLDDAAASLVLAEEQNLILDEGNYELDFFGRHVEDDALDDVIPLLAEHHLDQQLLVKFSNNFLLLVERHPNECLLNDPAAKLVE